MKCRRCNSMLNGPVHRAPEDIFSIIIHAKHKTPINHDAERVQAIRNSLIVAPEVLPFVASLQVFRCERLETDKDASQTGFSRTLDQIPAKNRVHGCCALKQPPHPLHSVEQTLRKTAVTEQMIVEKVKMTSRQPFDLSQRILHPLCI